MTDSCSHSGCTGIRRRTFLADMGMGFTGMALGAMLSQTQKALGAQSSTWSAPDGNPSFAPKAKSVIWLFMLGGVSHMESFDPKPELVKYADKTLGDTPHAHVLDNPLVKENLRELVVGNHKQRTKLFGLQVGYRKRGQSGIEVSDWFPHIGGCVDDLALVRSMWTTDNDHGAQLQFHTGRHVLEGPHPTIGAWVHYGLGTLNENLPQFVVLGKPIDTCCGGLWGHGASYLGPEHDGVQLDVEGDQPLPYVRPADRVYREEQRKQFELLNRLNRIAEVEYPQDPALRARIKSFELAYRMQMSVPETLDLSGESQHVKEMYGLHQPVTAPFAKVCMSARRLVERGVRFVQVFHGHGGAGAWDAHSGLKKNHETLCAQVDQPVAGLLKDLKQRGMLDETLVVWGTEFGRTPGSENADGRDHHPYGFSVWMAGGGIKGGVVEGATDELGFHAAVDRHYITDVHATVLRQMGLDSRKLEVPGRKRLEIDHGEAMHRIIA